MIALPFVRQSTLWAFDTSRCHAQANTNKMFAICLDGGLETSSESRAREWERADLHACLLSLAD
jgi:hypothetical protein